MAAISRLRLSAVDYEEMRRGIAHVAPEEGCGLLGGEILTGIGLVKFVLPITNTLHSRTRFKMDPVEQLAAFEQLDAQGLALIGIYHSHPNGPPAPSSTDLDEAFYPEAAYLIWSRSGSDWSCRAFDLETGQMISIDVISPDSSL